MTKKVVYVCEICGKESEDKEKIALCEAQHFGLSVDEKQEYNRICRDVIRWKYQADRQLMAIALEHDADEISAILNDYQNRLVEFEAKHGIKPEQSQIHLYKIPAHLQK